MTHFSLFGELSAVIFMVSCLNDPGQTKLNQLY